MAARGKRGHHRLSAMVSMNGGGKKKKKKKKTLLGLYPIGNP